MYGKKKKEMCTYLEVQGSFLILEALTRFQNLAECSILDSMVLTQHFHSMLCLYSRFYSCRFDILAMGASYHDV